jgi:uncharacterized protein (DUF305 family)
MKIKPTSASLALFAMLTLTGVQSMLQPLPASAQANDAASIDCSQADAMMQRGMMASPQSSAKPSSTGDVDKDFVTAMVAQHRAAMAMASVEVKCGKNANIRAAAQKALTAEQELLATMVPFMNVP